MALASPEFRSTTGWNRAAARSAKRKIASPQPPEGGAWSASIARNGRSEHLTNGIVAFANLRLPVAAFHGKRWELNSAELVREVTEILSNEDTVGVCFSALGTTEQPLTTKERQKFEEAMHKAINAMQSTSWCYPTFAWPKADGTTFAMCMPKVKLEHLPPLTDVGTDAEAFRSVEVFRFWLTENASVLLFNQHQTVTKEAKYLLNAKVAVCTAIIHAALREQQPTDVGFMCGGPAKCDRHTWSRAYLWHPNRAEAERRFGPMQFVQARQAIINEFEIEVHGDCYVALTNKEFVLKQRHCTIRNIDNEHDVVLMDWSFTYYDWLRGATEHTEERGKRARSDKARGMEDSSASDESDESSSESGRSVEANNAEESCDWSADSDEDEEDEDEDEADAESLSEDEQELRIILQERAWNCGVILAVACDVLPGVGTRRKGKTSELMQPPDDFDVPEMALRDLIQAADMLLFKPKTASASEHGYSEVRTLKPIYAIKTAFRDILWWRRQEEPDDTLQLSPEQIARAWTNWMHHWLYYNLTPDQRRLKRSQKTSIFASFIYNNYGSKYLVRALLETGITWAPPKELRREAAYKHVAIHFVRWLRNLTNAIRLHKEHWTTEEARQRSGFEKNTSGLTAKHKKIRDMRKSLRSQWNQSEKLIRRLKAAKARGEKKVTLTRNEHILLKERESGLLWKLVQRANTLHGGIVEAKRFTTRVDE